jgi:hypothetical protein
LDTRILQAQANQEPFLDTFSMVLQDELDRRRSSLMERRYHKSGLDERATLTDFGWRFNPKLPVRPASNCTPSSLSPKVKTH